MFRTRFLWAAALILATNTGASASAQDFLSGPMQWQQSYLTSVVSSTVLDNLEEDPPQDSGARGSPEAIGAYAFTPSPERRQENFAGFVAEVRKNNPADADSLQNTLSQDVIGMMGQVLAPFGFDMNNLADAYAFWWLSSWDTAQGVVRDSLPSAQVAAVKAQVAAALAGVPQLQQASEADKQQMAEIYWVQSLILNSATEAATSDPAVMRQLAASARRGAAEAGLDLDAMELTEAGFVSK